SRSTSALCTSSSPRKTDRLRPPPIAASASASAGSTPARGRSCARPTRSPWRRSTRHAADRGCCSRCWTAITTDRCRTGGVEQRELPRFAAQSFQQWARRHQPDHDGFLGEVMLWPDTFTNFFHPHIAQAAVALLEAAGWTVRVPAQPLCCGLTWISTGQLATARRILQRSVATLSDHLERGGLVLGLEPSCTAVFRSDAAELFPGDP